MPQRPEPYEPDSIPFDPDTPAYGRLPPPPPPASPPVDLQPFVRPAIVVFIALMLIFCGIGVVRYVLSADPVPQATQQPLPPVKQDPLKPTNLDQVKLPTGLGPFEHVAINTNAPTPDTQYPAVLLIGQDGSVQASQRWSVPFEVPSNNWTHENSQYIQRISTQNGYATFGTDEVHTFVVQTGQAFLFERDPNQVVVIDAQGEQWTTHTDRALLVRQRL